MFSVYMEASKFRRGKPKIELEYKEEKETRAERGGRTDREKEKQRPHNHIAKQFYKTFTARELYSKCRLKAQIKLCASDA